MKNLLFLSFLNEDKLKSQMIYLKIFIIKSFDCILVLLIKFKIINILSIILNYSFFKKINYIIEKKKCEKLTILIIK